MILGKSITIIGYSGHSFEIIKTLIYNKFIIKGYLENEQKKYNPFSLDYLGNERDKNTSAIFKNEPFIIAIGSNSKRLELANYISKKGGYFVNAIHYSALITDIMSIGVGNFVSKNVCINFNSKIEDHTIINTGAIIEHDCKVESGVHVGPGAVICGGVILKKNSFIGANSVIKENVCIGENVIIGAGSVVVKNIPKNSLSFGNPSRVVNK